MKLQYLKGKGAKVNLKQKFNLKMRVLLLNLKLTLPQPKSLFPTITLTIPSIILEVIEMNIALNMKS